MGCVPPAVAEFNGLDDRYGERYIPISHYLSFAFTTPEMLDRLKFYGYWSIPHAFFDGQHSSGTGEYVPAVTARMADTSPISIGAYLIAPEERRGTLYTHIEITDTLATTDNMVCFAVCEGGKLGGGFVLRNLLRDMLPEAELDIYEPGETADFVRYYVIDEKWDPSRITLVVFVQSRSGDKRVLQAARAVHAQGMAISPPTGLVMRGGIGGPYEPSDKVFCLANTGRETLEYSVSHEEPWLSIEGASGTIPPEGMAAVRVKLNELARLLPAGCYKDVLTFENADNHVGDDARTMTLRVGELETKELYLFDFEDDPGWRAGLNWQRWAPLGAGGENGHPDPTSAHSGEKVFGYNMNGDYENGLMKGRLLITSALDCSGFVGTTLGFWRWLGVDECECDLAAIHVSNDSLYWSPVWRNSAAVTDSVWTFVEYDISHVADDEPTVYVRWTMGPTDFSERYCGWNLDDVEIRAAPAGADPFTGLPNFSCYPNPARHSTTFLYELPAPAHARLAIYDVSGRLVRVVREGREETGWGAARWDGTDARGVPVASGVYLSRLVAGPATATRKIVVLR